MESGQKSLSQIAGEGTVWVSFTNIVTKATSFLSVFIILHKLSVYEYGVFQLVLSIFTVGGLFILSNLTDVIITDVSLHKEKNPSKSKGILNGFFKAQIALAVLSWAVLFFFAPLIAENFFGPHVASFIKIVSFYFLISPFRTLYNILFIVSLSFGKNALASILEEILRLISIFALLFIYEKGVAGLLIAQVFAQVLTVVLIYPLFKKSYAELGQAEIKTSIFDILLKHGKWALFVSYVSNLNKSLRVWLIKIFIGTEAVGLFSVASGLFGHVKSLLPFHNIITPIVPRYINDKEKVSRILSKSLKYLLAGFVCLGLAALIIFPPIIVFLFPHYASAMTLYKIMLLGLLPNGLAVIVTPIFYSLQKQRSLFFAYLSRIIMTLILLPLAIKFFGIMGIAYEFVLTGALFALERYFITKKYLPYFKIKIKDFFTVDSFDAMIIERVKVFLKDKLMAILFVR